ncbi:hypothetical protein MRX96_007188 [Rhipicephalus microplus]
MCRSADCAYDLLLHDSCVGCRLCPEHAEEDRSSTFCHQFVPGAQGAAKRHLRMPAMLLSGACLICEYQRPGTACVVAKRLPVPWMTGRRQHQATQL